MSCILYVQLGYSGVCTCDTYQYLSYLYRLGKQQELIFSLIIFISKRCIYSLVSVRRKGRHIWKLLVLGTAFLNYDVSSQVFFSTLLLPPILKLLFVSCFFSLLIVICVAIPYSTYIWILSTIDAAHRFREWISLLLHSRGIWGLSEKARNGKLKVGWPE